MRQRGISMLGQRQGMPRWSDDTVQRRDAWCQQTGQETDYLLEESLTAGGVDRGVGTNIFITISDRS